MRTFGKSDLESLSKKAESCDRLRDVHLIHPHEYNGPRLIANCFFPDSYCQPHRHNSDFGEGWIYVSGPGIWAVLFEDDGRVKDSLFLSGTDKRFIEIPPKVFHTGFSMGPTTMLELSQGPYVADDYKEFALWAPSEAETILVKPYFENLRRTIGI